MNKLHKYIMVLLVEKWHTCLNVEDGSQEYGRIQSQ